MPEENGGGVGLGRRGRKSSTIWLNFIMLLKMSLMLLLWMLMLLLVCLMLLLQRGVFSAPGSLNIPVGVAGAYLQVSTVTAVGIFFT